MRKIKPREYFLEIEHILAKYYDLAEATSMASILFGEYLKIDRAKLIINDEVMLNEDSEQKIEDCLEDLKRFIPIQYIIGSAPFFGREFSVNNNVLIPRPETEELVEWIISENKEKDRVLDIGTGTGCIPITLNLELDLEAYALDVSEEALFTAKQNSQHLAASVEFFHIDVLLEKLPISHLNIIVSNPPYVLQKEKIKMEKNVLDHEPGLALFVPDSRPLLFYEEIANKSITHLIPGGKLYFEINENFSAEVVSMLQENGFQDIEVRKDINGRDRMVRGVTPS